MPDVALTVPDSIAGVADLFRPFARVAVSRDGDAFLAVTHGTDTRTALALLPRERPVVFEDGGKPIAILDHGWGALVSRFARVFGERAVRVFGRPSPGAIPRIVAMVEETRSRAISAPPGPFARALRAAGLEVWHAISTVDVNDEDFWTRLFDGHGLRAVRAAGMLDATCSFDEPVETSLGKLKSVLADLAEWGLPPPPVRGLKGLESLCAMIAGGTPEFPAREQSATREDLLSALLDRLDSLGHPCATLAIDNEPWTVTWADRPGYGTTAVAIRVHGRERDPADSPLARFGSQWIESAHRAGLAVAVRTEFVGVENARAMEREGYGSRFLVPHGALGAFYAELAGRVGSESRSDGCIPTGLLAKVTLAAERPPVPRGWTWIVGEPPEAGGRSMLWP